MQAARAAATATPVVARSQPRRQAQASTRGQTR